MIEWIAHRGESHLAPENTLPAIELAWQLGADAVEIDVRLTRDRRLVLSHDPDTERTTGKLLTIAERDADELTSLDAGSSKGARWSGTLIPTFEQALSTLPGGLPASAGGNRRLFIEVKDGPESLQPLLQAIHSTNIQPYQLVIISFQVEVVSEAKRLLPDHKTYLLISRKPSRKQPQPPTVEEMIDAARDSGADGLDVGPVDEIDHAVDAPLVAAARDAGLKIYAWTTDDPAEVRRLMNLGIDGITSNRPAWLRAQVLKNPGGALD
jgi:glycerophosphoryl diester phosphodiesterase